MIKKNFRFLLIEVLADRQKGANSYTFIFSMAYLILFNYKEAI